MYKCVRGKRIVTCNQIREGMEGRGSTTAWGKGEWLIGRGLRKGGVVRIKGCGLFKATHLYN